MKAPLFALIVRSRTKTWCDLPSCLEAARLFSCSHACILVIARYVPAGLSRARLLPWLKTLFHIEFAPEVFQQIGKLFQIMDTLQAGVLTSDSFTVGAQGLYFSQNFGQWKEIQQFFDADGNNAIDTQEFVDGIARLCLQEQLNLTGGTQITLEAFYTQMSGLVQQKAQEKIQLVYQSCIDKLGANYQYTMPPAYVQPVNRIYKAEVQRDVIAKMAQIFLALNVTGTGEINAEDFMRRSKGHDFQSCLYNFDVDGSGTIDERFPPSSPLFSCISPKLSLLVSQRIFHGLQEVDARTKLPLASQREHW